MEDTCKTAYEWCLDYNIRVLDLEQWPLLFYDSKEKHFFEFEFLTEGDFKEALKSCEVKPNSRPRKTKPYLNYRMYGLVPYNLSEIQKGIQYGHSVVEYFTLNKDDETELILNKWAKKDKTFIILNGGTTNENKGSEFYGTLQTHRDTLRLNDIFISEFKEPDLNNTLTAITFLVDERVYDRVSYPDFIEEKVSWKDKKNVKEVERIDNNNRINYVKWVDKIGGVKNVFLRDFLKNFKLA